jgi:phosphoenolpyruvate-protein phosphotransferase
VAQEVTPSEILDFAKGKLQGVCLDSGGATSHVAILSAALGIPSVFGLSNLSLVARTGNQVLIDTRKECRVVLNPQPGEINQLEKSLHKKIKKAAPISDVTEDGIKIKLGVNIARSEELPVLKKLGLKRIGLFRSEFIFMESMDLPSEKFQQSVYAKVVEAAPEMAVLRTMDIGSDKPLKYLPLLHEENPAMGFRSIRFSLSRPEILKSQLRAMFGACKHRKVKIIFPMISVADELEKIEKIYKEVSEEMQIDNSPEWGIMLEVPSAAFMLDKIAIHTKYISLGTNDLQQFFYGVDRTNEKLAGLSNHLDQPFLRFLSKCVSEAKKLGLKISVCGEMASDPGGLLVLIGLGIDEVSVRTSAVQTIGSMIPKINTKKAKQFVKKIIETNGITDVRKEILKEFPNLTDFFT